MPNPQTSGPGYLCLSSTLLQLVQYEWSYQQLGCCQHSFRVTHMHASSHTQPNLPSTRWRYQQVSLLQHGIPLYPIVRMAVSVYQFHFFTFLQYVSQPHIFLWLTWFYPQYYQNLPYKNRIFFGQLQVLLHQYLK